MDSFLLMLCLWAAGSAPYVLPFVIGKLWRLVWWLPKAGKSYHDNATNSAYRMTYVGNLTISAEDRNGTKFIFVFPQFRKRFKRKPVTLKMKARGYAQSAKKLSKQRLTYRELQSRNILLDNEVKRLHAEVKVLRVNPGLRQRFGEEISTSPVEKGALKCAKDLREYAKDLREGAEEIKPLLMPVCSDYPRVWPLAMEQTKDGRISIIGGEPIQIAHYEIPRPKKITVHLDNETERAMVGTPYPSGVAQSPMQMAKLLKSSRIPTRRR